MPTLLSMVCKICYTITLMTCCTGRLGDALDLIQDCRWCPEGYIATYRMCFESHGPPQQQTKLHGSPLMYKDYYRSTSGTRMMHLVQYAQLTHKSITHLAGVPRLVRWHGNIHSIIWALTDGLQAFSTHMETHEVIGVPPYPQGAPHVYCLENKGPPSCPSLFRIIFIIIALMDLIKPLGGPYDMHRLLFDLLRGLLFHLWASLVGLSPKVS